MDTTSTKKVLSLIATTSSRIRDLSIVDGQLIFMQDVGRIAFDYKGKRVFYNQIVTLSSEGERLSIDSPLNGYYFVIDSASMWFYQDEWIPITSKPEQIVFIGVELPELGQEQTIYINKAEKEVSVWDEELSNYITVADYTDSVSASDIDALFE